MRCISLQWIGSTPLGLCNVWRFGIIHMHLKAGRSGVHLGTFPWPSINKWCIDFISICYILCSFSIQSVGQSIPQPLMFSCNIVSFKFLITIHLFYYVHCAWLASKKSIYNLSLIFIHHDLHLDFVILLILSLLFALGFSHFLWSLNTSLWIISLKLCWH